MYNTVKGKESQGLLIAEEGGHLTTYVAFNALALNTTCRQEAHVTAVEKVQERVFATLS